MTRRALVIGGSIGGLFAANALRGVGWDVTVFERVEDDLASRGASIGIHDELLEVMSRMGLPVDDSIGVMGHTRICLDRTGRVTHQISRSQLQSSWARLYRLLKDAFPAADYRFGMALARYERERRLFSSRVVARSRRLGAYIEAQLKPPSERTEADRQPPPEYLMHEIGTINLDIRALTAPG